MASALQGLCLSVQLGKLCLKGLDDQSAFKLRESLGLVIARCCFLAEATAVTYRVHTEEM